MGQMIPINPEVLRWARKTAGWSLEDVALKMQKDVDMVSAWETGAASPTYIQLEKLAYQIYKRPIALFFFPAPPEEKTPKRALIKISKQELIRILPRLRFLFRRARAIQIKFNTTES